MAPLPDFFRNISFNQEHFLRMDLKNSGFDQVGFGEPASRIQLDYYSLALPKPLHQFNVIF
jgi:hypothetical protein